MSFILRLRRVHPMCSWPMFVCVKMCNRFQCYRYWSLQNVVADWNTSGFTNSSCCQYVQSLAVFSSFCFCFQAGISWSLHPAVSTPSAPITPARLPDRFRCTVLPDLFTEWRHRSPHSHLAGAEGCDRTFTRLNGPAWPPQSTPRNVATTDKVNLFI